MVNSRNYFPRQSVLFVGFIHFIVAKSFENMIEYNIKENQPAGLVIGKMSDTIKSNTNPTWFLASEDSLRFLLGQENPNFHLNPKTGVLISKKTIDLEELCPQNCINEKAVIHLTVNIWSRDKLQGIAKVTIVITDVNDNSPYFDPGVVNIPVKEMVYTTGKTIDLPRAIDLDIAMVNKAIEYKLKTQSTHFELRIKNNIQPYLILTKTMDSEEVELFELYLLAWNKEFHESKAAELKIIITVLDINDNEPSFSKSIYLVPVPETAAVGSVIYQVQATDPDKISRLTYSSIFEIPSVISSMFKVNNDGSVVLLRSLDYESQQFYQLSVRVTDGEFNSFTKIKIVVMDINDQAPEFSINPSRISIYENTEISEIAQLYVVDRDSEDINGAITCYEPTGLKNSQIVTFISHPNNNLIFTLRLSSSLDRDKLGGDQQYAVFVCHDNGIPTSLTATYTVTIHVKDRNDNRPVFVEYSHNVTMRENLPNTDIIFKFHAKDIDKDENGKVQYDILSNGTDDKCCSIDPNTGQLYSKKSLDRESRDFYQIIVTATDQAVSEPRFTSFIRVNITVADENDEIPRLIEPNNLSIMENQPSGTMIGRLFAEDNDAGRNGRVKFSLISSSKSHYFYLSSNGSLFSQKSFDREERDNYCIPISIEDMGTPVTNAVKTRICVNILDMNDNAPTISLQNFDEMPSQSPQTTSDAFYQLNISIHSLIQHPFAKFDVNDLDVDVNASVSLTLIPDPANTARSSRIISLDQASKQLYLLESPNLGDIGCYRYTLIAIDSGEPPLSTKKNLLICLTDQILNPVTPERENTVSKANILIVVTLAGTSAFLTALLVSAILCMIQPCRHLRRRALMQSRTISNPLEDSPDEIMINSQKKSCKKDGKFFSETLLEKNIENDLQLSDRDTIDTKWSCKMITDRDNPYNSLMMTQPHFIIGSEEQRSDSGRGASDEDNILPPTSQMSRLAQMNQNFLMKPLSSAQLCTSKDLIDPKVFENCRCVSVQQSAPFSIPHIVQHNINTLKILSSGGNFLTPARDVVTQSTSLIPVSSKDFVVENSQYTDSNVEPGNLFYPMDLSMHNVSDLSTHIDKLFFSHCCQKF